MNIKSSISLLILATLVFGCATSPRNPLVGKWKPVSYQPISATVELFEDGRAVVTIAEGNWTVLDNGRLQMHLNDEETTEAEFSIDGDKLTINGADGAEEFMRVK